MTKRPLTPATIRTEFGDVLDDPSFYDTGSIDRDLSYVPGFSEMRRARDLEIAEVASGRKHISQANIPTLPVNLRWERVSMPRGTPDSRALTESGNVGYRLVRKDQIGKADWLEALPPGATVDADGSIHKGDTVLMVCDGKTAARNAARDAALTARTTSEAARAASGLLDVAAKRPEVEAYIKREA